MKLLALPIRTLGIGWLFIAIGGGAILTVSGVWPLQILGGILIFSGLASPLVAAHTRQDRGPTRRHHDTAPTRETGASAADGDPSRRLP